ncbi:MAG TPA: 1,4-alpha-glucan branching protein domain-containing protein [Acidobacteriaceae bacterium]|nr:1,4-alpha-glucan branching protein domain-containing protein [Acidobacteriaceae bacterium]
MTTQNDKPAGFLALTLHAHLPYVVNHGTWPHGIEWLHEAAAETYLPLLRILANLERDNVPANLNINFSPILLEQLAHPYFLAEFPNYLTRKIIAAREDEAFFIQSGDNHLAETARFWNRFFTAALDDFNAIGGNIIQRFRHFAEEGLIEIITCAATHGYLPLLGTDESVRAQIRTGVSTHLRHFGTQPRGIWLPECGYRPSGPWTQPIADINSTEAPPTFDRIGIEQAVSESSLEFFIVDTHLVEQSYRFASPYGTPQSRLPRDSKIEQITRTPERSIYQPYYVDGPYTTLADKSHAATVFPRDPISGLQVWSGDTGYPGDPNYLDFHKRRFPGGHRYWQVTGSHVDIGDKQFYWPHQAAERTREHAQHFVSLVYEALEPSLSNAIPPILTAPFDAELFGHWWFEGPLWLEAVCRILHQRATDPSTQDDTPCIATITCGQYLDRYPRAGFIAMPEGSWGAEGDHQVWFNHETTWTYTHLYAAERFTREVCSSNKWRDSDLGTRIAKQLCRELLLLESSDWQFLITTGAARDYADSRFLTHNDQFTELKSIWQAFEQNAALNDHMHSRLTAIEERDNIFPDIDPTHWSTHNHATPPSTAAKKD